MSKRPAALSSTWFTDMFYLVVAVDVQCDRRRVFHILLLFHHMSRRAQFLAYKLVRRCDHEYFLRY